MVRESWLGRQTADPSTPLRYAQETPMGGGSIYGKQVWMIRKQVYGKYGEQIYGRCGRQVDGK
jgi:hypothetical protein